MQRIIVITGASDGVGAAAARRLAAEGHRIVVVGRTDARVKAVAREFDGDPYVADFSQLAEVRTLADALRDRYPRIDVLVNNAGGVHQKRITTVDGHELTFQVNHLAPFLLTTLLMETLRRSRASVITTSSMAAFRGRLDLADLQLERRWSPFRSYANSKLANILFTHGLHQRYVLDGVSAASFHPGLVATSFATANRSVMGAFYRSRLGQKVALTPDQGADTLAWLAEGTPPRDWAPGAFYVQRAVRRPPRQAQDDGLSDALWVMSERMVGLA